jgi:hypothetical protein
MPHLLLCLGQFVPRIALVISPFSTVILDKGPYNHERSVPFCHSYNTSPLISFLLLVVLAVLGKTLLVV